MPLSTSDTSLLASPSSLSEDDFGSSKLRPCLALEVVGEELAFLCALICLTFLLYIAGDPFPLPLEFIRTTGGVREPLILAAVVFPWLEPRRFLGETPLPLPLKAPRPPRPRPR